MRKCVWIGRLVASVLLIAATPTIAFAAGEATDSPVFYNGTLKVSSQTFGGINYVRYRRAAYISETQVIRILNQFGLGAVNSSGALNALWLGPYHASSTIHLGKLTLKQAGAFAIHGNIYANLSRVAQVKHWRLTYNGSTGSLHVQPGPAGTSSRPVVAEPAVKMADTIPVNKQAAALGWSSFQGEKVMGLTIGKTTYVGIWYLLHTLHLEGYQASYRGHQLVIQGLPSVVQDGALVKAGRTDITTLIRYHGDWFAPLSSFTEGLGLVGGVDTKGDVTFENAPVSVKGTVDAPLQGSITVSLSPPSTASTAASATASGTSKTVTPVDNVASFILQDGSVVSASVQGQVTQVSLPGTSALLMGYKSPAYGWVGMGTAVNKTTSSIQLLSSVATGSFEGRIDFDSTPVGKESVVIRDVATHAEFSYPIQANGRYAGKLAYGVYELWAIRAGGESTFIGSRFVIDGPSNTLGTIHQSRSPVNGIVVGAHCIVMAQDLNVTGVELTNAARIFERIYHQDVQQFKMRPTLPVTIQVFGSGKQFTQHFLDESYGTSVSGTYGQDAQAVTEGAQYIALNTCTLGMDGEINVLAHEFTHALLQANLPRVPTWLNEGLAWHQGISAELGQSPLPLLSQALYWNLWTSPLDAAKTSQLYPLLTTSSVAPKYNVEAQDNYAVEDLIDTAGWSKVLTFLKQSSSIGEGKAFQSVYHESEGMFAAQVNDELQTDATASATGLMVKVQTGIDIQGEIFVSNPYGKTFVFTGAKPNLVYSFDLSTQGQVTTPAGLTLVGTSVSPVDGYWDIGTESGQSQSFFSINNKFGVGFLVTNDTFIGTSNVAVAHLGTELPLGMQLVSVKLEANKNAS